MPRKKILIIEDNRDLCILLGVYFRAVGYEPAYAESSSEGIRKALAENPDLIITDLNLPDVSGIEATELLKQNPATSSIPVVMLTAAANEEWKIKALKAGVAMYLVKPIALPDLVSTVRSLTDSIPIVPAPQTHLHGGSASAG
jgi:DNA-binding response OmpR family regulator